MSVQEIVVGIQWLQAILGGDSALSGFAPGGVHRGLAPPGTATPYVIINAQAASDSITMNAFRLLVSALYQVIAVGPASAGTGTTGLANAAARIDALIGSPPTSGTVTGGYVAASYRQSPLFLDEVINGEMWSRIGGLYRLSIESY
jgi:hypothetical protein